MESAFGIAYMEDAIDIDDDDTDGSADPREELERYLKCPQEKTEDVIGWWAVSTYSRYAAFI